MPRPWSLRRSTGWDWFNNRRLLSSIGDVPPVEYEEQYYQAQNAPATGAGVN